MATPREEREYAELSLVSALGVRSSGAGDRETLEEPCPLRTCFQRDVDRITHCKAFRRLKHKTQVFLQPEGDHSARGSRTRWRSRASPAPSPARSGSTRT